jgi:peroxiredoxin
MPNPRRTPILIALAVAIAAVAATVAYPTLVGRPAAPVVSYTLLDGSSQRLDALRGKVVLVNFWATTCAICVQKMPDLVATHQTFRAHGFETLAVAMSHDPPAYVARFAETRDLPFGVVIDNTGEIARRFGDVRLTPTTFVIDKRGDIVKRYVGAPDVAELHALVERLLAES